MPEVTLHTARHGSVNYMISLGVPLLDVAKWLGDDLVGTPVFLDHDAELVAGFVTSSRVLDFGSDNRSSLVVTAEVIDTEPGRRALAGVATRRLRGLSPGMVRSVEPVLFRASGRVEDTIVAKPTELSVVASPQIVGAYWDTLRAVAAS